jgi:hypothetical protein
MKMKHKTIGFLIILMGFAAVSCVSFPGGGNNFALHEARTPDPNAAPAPEAAQPKEEIWVDFSASEIEREGGRQVRIFSILSGSSRGITRGMKGTIYADALKSRVAGEVVVDALGNGFVLFRITSLNFIIDRGATVSVQIQ